MELGCGTALASIAIAKLALGGGGRGSDVASSSSSSSSSIIIATDANSEVLALAQRNIERNNLVDVAKTVALQWGLLDATEYESSADVIIGSDLTYNSGSWVVLAETMSTILKPEGILIYLVRVLCVCLFEAYICDQISSCKLSHWFLSSNDFSILYCRHWAIQDSMLVGSWEDFFR